MSAVFKRGASPSFIIFPLTLGKGKGIKGMGLINNKGVSYQMKTWGGKVDKLSPGS